MRNTPWLVQRIKRARSSVPPYFNNDYMDAPEFEHGALAEAAVRMEAEDAKEPYVITELFELPDGKGLSCFYIGPVSRREIATTFFRTEINPITCGRIDVDIKRATCIWRTYSCLSDDPGTFVGWWALDPGLEFVLFTQAGDAQWWLDALRRGRDGLPAQ